MNARSQDIALRASGLRFSYGSETLAFPDIQLPCGESCAVVGPSGSGKSTLLHLIAGLRTPAAGLVEIAGERMDTLPQGARDQLRGRRIGIVLQQLRLVNALSVLENLLLAQQLGGGTVDRRAASQLLDELQLGHRIHAKPRTLSQGEAQRVAIARALVGRPTLIVADEPTSALDDDNAARVLALLVGQAKQHQAGLLVVTHDGRIRGRLDQQIELSALEAAA